MLNYLKRKISILLLLLCTLCLWSCEDVFEEDISDDSVKLLSPKDSLNSSSNQISFSWESIEGADKYQLQVVSGSFANTSQMLCDSNLTQTFFTMTFTPGTYQWRVRAKNFAYESMWTTRTFSVTLTPDLSAIIPQLINPVNGDTTRKMSFLFKWNSILYADDYRFEIWKDAFASGTKIVSIILDTNYFNYTLPEQGLYYWALRGQNTYSNSVFSTASLFIDTIAPNTSMITFPQYNLVVTDSIVNFTWQRTAIAGSAEFDSLFLYADSLMNNLIGVAKSNNFSYSKKMTNGRYWWKLKPWDRAGNTNAVSGPSVFTVQRPTSGKKKN